MEVISWIICVPGFVWVPLNSYKAGFHIFNLFVGMQYKLGSCTQHRTKTKVIRVLNILVRPLLLEFLATPQTLSKHQATSHANEMQEAYMNHKKAMSTVNSGNRILTLLTYRMRNKPNFRDTLLAYPAKCEQ